MESRHFIFQSVCRDIICSLDGEFSSDDLCLTKSTSDGPICVGVFLKLEPFSLSEYLLRNEFQDDTYSTKFVNDVIWEVKRLGYVSLDSYIIFTDKTSDSYKEGIINEIYIYAELSGPEKEFDAIANSILNTNGNFATLQKDNEHQTQYVVILDFLNITDKSAHTFDAEIFITTSQVILKIGEFVVLSRKQLTNKNGENNEVIEFSKISTCPHIEVRPEDLKTHITIDGILASTENRQIVSNLTRFQYQQFGGKVYLCLNDFKTFYQYVPMPLVMENESTYIVGNAVPRPCNVHVIAYLSCFTIVYSMQYQSQID